MRLRERRARPLMKQLSGQFCHQLHAAWRIRLRPSARRGPMGDRRPPGYSQLPGWSDYITGCKRIQPHHLVPIIWSPSSGPSSGLAVLVSLSVDLRAESSGRRGRYGLGPYRAAAGITADVQVADNTLRSPLAPARGATFMATLRPAP